MNLLDQFAAQNARALAREEFRITIKAVTLGAVVGFAGGVAFASLVIILFVTGGLH